MGEARDRSFFQSVLLFGGGILSPPGFDALGVGALEARPLGGILWVRLFFALVIVAIAVSLAHAEGPIDIGDLILGSLVLAASVAVFLVLSLVPKRLNADLGGRDAVVSDRGFLGSGRWTAPLASFSGLAWRSNCPTVEDAADPGESFSRRGEAMRNLRRAVEFHWIELVHPDPRKTLLLHFQANPRGMRDKIELYSRRLERPIIVKPDGY